MKFTDGYWTIREGVQHYFAPGSRSGGNTPCADRLCSHPAPGDTWRTLDGPILTVQFSSPMPDVIRVKLFHFAGQPPRPPNFELSEDPEPGSHFKDEKSATLTSGKLSASVSHGDDWRVDFRANVP